MSIDPYLSDSNLVYKFYEGDFSDVMEDYAKGVAISEQIQEELLACSSTQQGPAEGFIPSFSLEEEATQESPKLGTTLKGRTLVEQAASNRQLPQITSQIVENLPNQNKLIEESALKTRINQKRKFSKITKDTTEKTSIPNSKQDIIPIKPRKKKKAHGLCAYL